MTECEVRVLAADSKAVTGVILILMGRWETYADHHALEKPVHSEESPLQRYLAFPCSRIATRRNANINDPWF